MKIKDIATYIKRGITPQYTQNDGIPVINQKCIKNGVINKEFVKYTSKGKKYPEEKRIRKGDILINSTGSGTLGRVAYVNSNEIFSCVDSHVTILRCKNYESKFLYYWLRPIEPYIESLGKGSTNQLELSSDVVSEIDIPDFPLKTQEKIASILSAYDDLIENNRKQIKLLEEAAQRLYKEWFVDLKFPGHEKTKIIDGVPEGWVQCRLENVIHFNPKVTLSKERMKQSIPMSALSTTSMVLNADDFTTTLSNSGSKFQNGDTLLARITPCLENGKTAFVSGIESDEGAVGSTEFIIMRSNGISPYMVYLLARTEDFRQEAINSMIGSDGRQRAQVDKIKVLPYLKPSATIIKAFEKCVAPLFAQIQTKNKQYAELKQARDRLLPKLMSGEMEV